MFQVSAVSRYFLQNWITYFKFFFEARSQEDLLDDEIDMASKVEVLEQFVRQQQEQIAAMNCFVEQSLNSKASIDTDYSLKQDDVAFSSGFEERNNKRNLEEIKQATNTYNPTESKIQTEEKFVTNKEISFPTINQYKTLSSVRDITPEKLDKTLDTITEQQLPATNNTTSQVQQEISKEEQLRRKIMENLDDAFDLANKVDEIEIVIQERSATDAEDHPYYDEPFDPNEPVIEEIDIDEMGYDQFDDGEYVDDDWEDEYSGSDNVNGSVEEEGEESEAVSDVDDAELMRRLEEKYGKLE